MIVFGETLDPSEKKDFTFDWTPKLGSGETIETQDITFIDTAGATCPAESVSTPYSSVWLTGGNDGGRVIFVIRIHTSGGRDLEQALAVDVVDALSIPAATPVSELIAMLAAARAQRHLVATGEAVVEVMRNGRKVTRKVASMAEMQAYILTLEREIAQAQSDADGRPRRRAIGLMWRN